jgi:hypothetical protein
MNGLRENFGTMMKPFQAGQATESGVVAADFAAIGWTAAEQFWKRNAASFMPTAALTIPPRLWIDWAIPGHCRTRASLSSPSPRVL